MGSHICPDCGGTYVAAPGGFETHAREGRHVRAFELRLASSAERTGVVTHDRIEAQTAEIAEWRQALSEARDDEGYFVRGLDPEIVALQKRVTELEKQVARLIGHTHYAQAPYSLTNKEEKARW